MLERMQSTLRKEISEAVVTYEEKPREQWLFDYPAQVSNDLQSKNINIVY